MTKLINVSNYFYFFVINGLLASCSINQLSFRNAVLPIKTMNLIQDAVFEKVFQ